MTLCTRLPLLALALTLPMPLLAQAAQDFSLPPNPTPSATPRVQGPVDEEAGPLPARPRVIRTATPTPTPAPSPTGTSAAAPSPAARIPVDERVFAPASGQTGAPARPQPRATGGVAPGAVPSADATPVGEAIVPGPQPSVASPPALPAVGPATSLPADESAPALPFDWRWLAGLGAGLAAAFGGLLYWRRRRAKAPPPAIERPVVGTAPRRPAVPAAEALSIRCEAEKLTRSAAFATLKYRFTLINRTDAPLTDVAIGLDLVSAHANAPMEEQVATPGTVLDTRHTLARIAPHQTVAVEGQVQLPLAGAQVILQGRHPLLVPLLRLRVDGAGEGSLIKTFVIGQGLPGGGRVQPFRLDEAPRSYAPLAHRELA